MDYIPLVKTVLFLQTGRVFCVSVTILDDDIALEGDEQFAVNISVPMELSGLYIGASPTTIITIVDDDGNLTQLLL